MMMIDDIDDDIDDDDGVGRMMMGMEGVELLCLRDTRR